LVAMAALVAALVAMAALVALEQLPETLSKVANLRLPPVSHIAVPLRLTKVYDLPSPTSTHREVPAEPHMPILSIMKCARTLHLQSVSRVRGWT
jgi:hypothetical protein